MFIKEGFTIWARKTTESEIFQNKPDKWFKIFFYLVMRANHTKTKQYKRGDSWTTYEKIMEVTGATKGVVDHCLRHLRENGALITRKSTRGFNFTIVKYDFYQNPVNYSRDLGATQTRFRRDTINKNDKNDKNDNLGGASNKKSNLLGYFENNPVFNVDGKPRVKCADGEWRDYVGNIKDLTKNKVY